MEIKQIIERTKKEYPTAVAATAAATVGVLAGYPVSLECSAFEGDGRPREGKRRWSLNTYCLTLLHLSVVVQATLIVFNAFTLHFSLTLSKLDCRQSDTHLQMRASGKYVRDCLGY